MHTIQPDFTVRTSTWAALLLIPLSLLIICCAPQHWSYENGVIENAQLILLLIGTILCLTARNHKRAYLFIAVVLIALAMREVNCGRVLLWSKPGNLIHCGPPEDYYKWKEIAHGPAIRTTMYSLLALGIATALLYKQAYRQLLSLCTQNKIPVVEPLLALLGTICGKLGENHCHNTLVEEMAETLIYAAIISLIYRYTRGLQTLSPTPTCPKN